LETGFCYAAQNGLQLSVYLKLASNVPVLPQPSESWDDRCVPPTWFIFLTLEKDFSVPVAINNDFFTLDLPGTDGHLN
jgi:hypothetical protein